MGRVIKVLVLLEKKKTTAGLVVELESVEETISSLFAGQFDLVAHPSTVLYMRCRRKKIPPVSTVVVAAPSSKRKETQLANNRNISQADLAARPSLVLCTRLQRRKIPAVSIIAVAAPSSKRKET
ncbi:hypothetical protein MRB53_006191 [Persea americana]|uniref:Uncharacterized protein n=1 Tax=Persea americana TaxID=3435 RepID=A0ACC2MGC9_PERAE|nr:hypothetical protein MRB53_006191 [Persea americana]